MSQTARGRDGVSHYLGWVILGVYVAGFVIAVRLYLRFADDDDARFNGTIIAFIWPLALVGLAVSGLLSLSMWGVKTPSERRAEAVTAEWERQKLATRTAELEAENERLRKAAGEDVTP